MLNKWGHELNTIESSSTHAYTGDEYPLLCSRPPPKQKREIQMAIRKNRETNAVLTRLNSELQQQLKVPIYDHLYLQFTQKHILS